MNLSERTLELAIVALESAAQACQFGADLRDKGIDPLAREYLLAASEIEALRSAPAASECTAHVRANGSGAKCDRPRGHDGVHSAGSIADGQTTWTRGLGSQRADSEGVQLESATARSLRLARRRWYGQDPEPAGPGGRS